MYTICVIRFTANESAGNRKQHRLVAVCRLLHEEKCVLRVSIKRPYTTTMTTVFPTPIILCAIVIESIIMRSDCGVTAML